MRQGKEFGIGSMMAKSSVLFHVASALSFEMSGTLVTCNCLGDWDRSGQSRPPLQYSAVSQLSDQKRN